MALRLYNTLTRDIREFSPIAPPEVTMYVCGPTVYDDPHIGHARSAFIFEVLRRYLEFAGYAVKFVRNVTDVDDKIIDRARRELEIRNTKYEIHDLGKLCNEVAERYLKSYHVAMDQLGIRRPDVEPKATEHVVPDMTDFIAKLLVNGVAYEADDGVYFSVRKCEGYGRLSNRTLDELQAGARVEPGEHPGPTPGAGKRDPLDFALWKAAKPGEPSWKSPWGEGRPGWHIECSTMSTKYLGEAFDIHGGGVDLVFPHHENEIAQAQAAGKPFARCWVHNGLLTVNGEKMSKSLGNFITVGDALETCYPNEPLFQPDVLKVFFLGAHYRSPLDYTSHNIKSARIRSNHYRDLYYYASKFPNATSLSPELSKLQAEFVSAMDDDLNTPRALAALDKITNIGRMGWIELETQQPSPTQAAALRTNIRAASNLIRELGSILGLFGGFQEFVEITLPSEITESIQRREQARNAKDFKTADRIRKELEAEGVIIEDTPKGPKVRYKR